MSHKKNHNLNVSSFFTIIVLMALTFFANDCCAESQRLVRIVWDVGMSEFYYRAEDLDNTTPGTWVVPAKEDMVSSGFIY
jgi:hypothetical protein